MERTYGSPQLPLCPHCGAEHEETALTCPSTHHTLPLQGRLLDGKFRLVVKLGEGGMGSVWRAENVLVHKTVAIKLLHAEYARNASTLARFGQEATAAGRIRNPHICDILDLGQCELGPYIVMELMKGRSLAQMVDSVGRIEPGMAVLIARQALVGLQAAHDAQIIHRDLKPENVFLHEPQKGRLLVKLVDFGISKFTEGAGGGQTRQGVLMGTPEYMSPEQAEGAANVDARTDVWAMGVILYRALTGREAFLGKTLAATLTNVTVNEPIPANQLAPDLPPGLVAIVHHCLVKDRDQRMPSAQALYDALAPYEHNASAETLQRAVAAPSYTAPPIAVAPGEPRPGALTQARAASLAGADIGGADTWSNKMAGPGDQAGRTWSAEVPSAPGPADSWTISGNEIGQRPDSVVGGGGSSFSTWIVALLVVGGLGFAVYKINDSLGETPPDVDVPAATAGLDTADSAGTDPVVKPDLPPETTSETTGDTKTDATGETADETDGDSGDSGDDTGETSGETKGDTKQDTKPDNTSKGPRPDMSLLVKDGSLYVPQLPPPRGGHPQATAHCRKLKVQKHGRLSGWRLPSERELRRLKVDQLLYWTRAKVGSSAKAINLMNGSVKLVSPGEGVRARALCVSKKR